MAPSFCLLVDEHKSSKIQEILPIFLNGETVVKVFYSGINYKDALAVKGNGILKKFPTIPGIDFSGTVERLQVNLTVDSSCEETEFKIGDRVICTGNGIGENFSGGFTQIACIPSPLPFLVKCPLNMSLREAMVLGTAGLTAMLCVHAIEANFASFLIRKKTEFPILVSGAGGGVGSIAVFLLSKLGFRVTAVTGRRNLHAKLLNLGAESCVDRENIVNVNVNVNVNGKIKPLDTIRWGGAVDTVGDKMLAAIVSQTANNRLVAACGLAGGSNLNLTVFPFILRGVILHGVDSVHASQEDRVRAWQRLADIFADGDRKSNYENIWKEEDDVSLADINDVAGKVLKGEIHGHCVVDVNKPFSLQQPASSSSKL